MGELERKKDEAVVEGDKLKVNLVSRCQASIQRVIYVLQHLKVLFSAHPKITVLDLALSAQETLPQVILLTFQCSIAFKPLAIWYLCPQHRPVGSS